MYIAGGENIVELVICMQMTGHKWNNCFTCFDYENFANSLTK